MNERSRPGVWWISAAVLGAAAGVVVAFAVWGRHDPKAEPHTVYGPPVASRQSVAIPAIRPGPAPSGAFASAPATPNIVTDPSSKDYDPIPLMRIIGASSLYSQEPRSDPWASGVEMRLLPLVSDDLQTIGAAVANLKVDCKTTTCQFSWDGPVSERAKVQSFLAAVWGGAGGQKGEATNTMSVVYAGGTLAAVPKGEAPALLTTLAHNRSARLESIKRQEARGLKLNRSVPRWPER